MKSLPLVPVPLPCLSVKGRAVQLEVVLAPRASRNAFIGLHDGKLKIAVTAPPVEDAANTALIEFIARSFKLPKRAVSISKGQRSKQKSLILEGADAASIAGALSDLLLAPKNRR